MGYLEGFGVTLRQHRLFGGKRYTRRYSGGRIARKGKKTPIQASQRWHVERTRAWQNAFHGLARCYERRATVIDAFFDLADTIITVRSLIRGAWTTHRGAQAFEDDHERDLELTALGFRVLRFTAAQIRTRPLDIGNALRAEPGLASSFR